MSFLIWDQSLDVKVGKMNDEHKILIDYMNRLHDKYESKAPRGDILSALDALYNYTVEHFRDEEKYLSSINYPVFDAHKRTHEDLLSTFQTHKNAFKNGKDLGDQFFTFLRSWLTNHIKVSDVSYGNYAEKSKAKA